MALLKNHPHIEGILGQNRLKSQKITPTFITRFNENHPLALVIFKMKIRSLKPE